MSDTTREMANSRAAEIIQRIRAKTQVGNDAPAPIERAKKATKPKVAATPIRERASAPAPVPVPKPPKQTPLCACGCGGHTKGGTYRPGHDSKHRSAQAPPRELPACGCGCGVQTKGGRFLPGHDARYYASLRKAEKEKATQAAQSQAAHLDAPPKRGKVLVAAAA